MLCDRYTLTFGDKEIDMGERLDGTVAVVTGASSGIGEATTRALAARGASVVGAARRKDRLDALVGEVESGGGTAVAIECDVTDQAQASALIAATIERFGRLDTLISAPTARHVMTPASRLPPFVGGICDIAHLLATPVLASSPTRPKPSSAVNTLIANGRRDLLR